MKSKNVITVVITLIIGFSIGLMTGVTLTSPGMSLREAAGTIGRVDQYRNVRITQKDIELQNDLMEDAQRREAFIDYLTYEYTNNLQMKDNVRLALASSQDADNFRNSNSKTIEQLDQYSEFLDNARLRTLEAIGALRELGDKDKVAIHTILKDAGNTLAQNNLRSDVLFDFMLGVERFFETASPGEFPDLANAHDRIFANLVAENLVKGDRPTLNHLFTKEFLGDVERLGQQYTDSEQLEFYVDAEQLGKIMVWDAEQLESLGLHDAEQLGQILFDAEKLEGGLLDAEQMGSLIMDTEQMGMINLDTEQLGTMLNAGHPPLSDSEQLGFADSEQLGVWDAEQLGAIWDAEQLGAFRDASDQLQLIIPL
ncbi:MAG: hypothetical protein ACLFN2_06555 [Bacteroidales bacterium]